MNENNAALTGNWNYPTRVRFGAGRIAELPEACKESGIARPLLVTDPQLAAFPMVQDALAANERAGLPTSVFSALKPNPVGGDVDGGVRAYRAGGHDGIIAFGGGSALDVGKAIAFMIAQSRPIWDFEDSGDYWTRANPEGIAPVVAVPTTSGTGSEVGRAAAIVNEATRTKKIIFHPRMMPAVVIADPALTTGLPPHITAATGMDALAHCLEAYCARGCHPLADGIAVEGLRLIREWLPTAVRDGGNLTARAHMMAAAAMGATAFQKGLGAIHALSHPVGALYDTHHGLTNAVFTPYVLVFNRPAIEERMTRLAAYLGLAKPGFAAVLDWIVELRRQIGIPHTARELGVEAQRVGELAEMAAQDPTAAGNPVPLSVQALAQLYRNALDGRV
ncbi:MAG: iron-containing alcohol dehydrogenase [SAR324 cluster bacterium]|nr:iron-containing alcohol dehydrogenase [SAR324 cluster bacterium]